MTTSFTFYVFLKFYSIASLTQYVFNIIISSINTVPTIFIFLTLTHFLFLTQPSMLSTLHLFKTLCWNFLECFVFWHLGGSIEEEILTRVLEFADAVYLKLHEVYPEKGKEVINIIPSASTSFNEIESLQLYLCLIRK